MDMLSPSVQKSADPFSGRACQIFRAWRLSPAVQQSFSPVFYGASTPPIKPRELGRGAEKLGEVRIPPPETLQPSPGGIHLSPKTATSQPCRPPGQVQNRQGRLGGSWDHPEAASDLHNILSEGPGTFRALSEGPGTFRKQRQTTGNDTKITEIRKIDGNGLRRFEMG